MGFLTENDSLACFEIFSHGLSATFDFLLILVGFSRRVIPCNALMFFHLAQEGKILKGKVFWPSAPNMKDIPYRIDSPKPWTGLIFSIFCSECTKPLPALSKKWA